MPDLGRFQWLLGKWEFITPDSAWHRENWEKQNDSLFGGFGFVRKNDSLVFSELLTLERAGEDIYYTAAAKGQNKDQAVRFLVTQSDSTGFTCENPQHDFPARITYRHAGRYPTDTLRAVIAGPAEGNNERQAEFIFYRRHP